MCCSYNSLKIEKIFLFCKSIIYLAHLRWLFDRSEFVEDG